MTWTLMKTTLKCSSMSMSYCNAHQIWCFIETSIDSYYTLWHALRFMSHCNNHQWLCRTIFDYGWPWFIKFNYGWSCLTIVWPCLNIPNYCWMWVDHGCFWLTMFEDLVDHALLYLIKVDHVWLCSNHGLLYLIWVDHV